MTQYLVLRRLGDLSPWEEVDTHTARSARAAITSAALEGDDGATYVAVPARSWKPVTVKVETKTALKFS